MKGIMKLVAHKLIIIGIFLGFTISPVHAGDQIEDNKNASAFSSPSIAISNESNNSILVSAGESIQDAIDSSSPGDVIWVASGEYTGDLSFDGKAITLRSIAGPEYTRIEGEDYETIDIGPGGSLLGFSIVGSANLDYPAIRVHGEETVIKGNIIEKSPKTGYGSVVGILGNTASPIITGNVFRQNNCHDQHGTGVVAFVNYSSPIISNNLFYDNLCPAITMSQPTGTHPQIINNTIIGNQIGIRVGANVDPQGQIYRNNILTENDIGFDLVDQKNDYSPTWESNLVYGNTVNYQGFADQTGTAGNLSADPLFRNSTNHDFHLSPGSPAIDSGSMEDAPSDDFEGFPRPIDGNNDGTALMDMGAFEKGYSAEKSVQGSFAPGGDVTYTITLVSEVESSQAAVSLTDEINPNLSFKPGTLTVNNGLAEEDNGVITWSGSVNSSDPTTINYSATVTDDVRRGTVITNTASIFWNATPLERRSNFYIPPAYSFLPCITRNYCPLGFVDDFENPNSGWPVDHDSSATFGYVDGGEYQIIAYYSNMTAAVRIPSKSENFRLGVELRNVQPTYNSHGLIFNVAEDWSHFYSFEIDPNGNYGIFRYSSENGWNLLHVDSSPFINTGNAQNKIEIRRDGPTIAVYANNHLLTAVNDDSYMGIHYVGLIVSTYDQGHVEVRFDNFYATPISCTDTPTLSAPDLTSSSQASSHIISRKGSKTFH